MRGIAALAVSILFTSVAAAQTPTPATPVAPAPAVATAPAPDPLVKALEAYAAFQEDVSALRSGALARPADVESALDRVASSNADALTRGWIAYGAMTAAQSKTFVDEARKVAAAYGPAVAAKGFGFGGSYAKTLKGGDEAMRLALAVAAADGDRVVSAGDRMKTVALDLQKAAWARTRVTAARPARVERLRKLAAGGAPRTVATDVLARLTIAPASVSPDMDSAALGGQAFWDMVRAAPAGAAVVNVASVAPTMRYEASPQQAAAVDVMTSVAALYAIDQLRAMPAEDVAKLLAPAATNECFRRAQLQFVQCVSTGEFHHENVACIGEAGLQTRGQCMRDMVRPAAVATAG